MKVYFKACLLLTGILVLCGCPYQSKVPMGSSQDSVIDRNLVGEWKLIAEKGQKPGSLSILKFNEHEYYIRLEEKGDKAILRLRAYAIMVEGIPFINAQYINDLDEDKRTFVFFSYSLSGDGILTLNIVGDELMGKSEGQDKIEFKTSKGLYEFIKNNVRNEKLYDESLKFKKTDIK